ncbi:hypothetical protein KC321_g50 [Hortaea werneckii]|nr:hypothetical protein KC321_g50 [Hortaea werneckii]
MILRLVTTRNMALKFRHGTSVSRREPHTRGMSFVQESPNSIHGMVAATEEKGEEAVLELLREFTNSAALGHHSSAEHPFLSSGKSRRTRSCVLSPAT